LVVRSASECEGNCERGGKGEWLTGEKRVWRRRGSEKGEAGRRVQGIQTQTPRSGFADPRPKVRGEPNAECGVKFHARISSSTVDPRKSPRNVQICRDVDHPVTIKAWVIESVAATATEAVPPQIKLNKKKTKNIILN
jgi:hypothetical protein